MLNRLIAQVGVLRSTLGHALRNLVKTSVLLLGVPEYTLRKIGKG